MRQTLISQTGLDGVFGGDVITDVELTAEDGFDTSLCISLTTWHMTKDSTVIGDGTGSMTETNKSLRYLLRSTIAIRSQEAKSSMSM